MAAMSLDSTGFWERDTRSLKPRRPSLEETRDEPSSITILSIEVDDRWSSENLMPPLQDWSNLARYSHVSTAIADLGSEKFDRASVLAQLTYRPSIIIHPWTGNASTFAQVLADEEL